MRGVSLIDTPRRQQKKKRDSAGERQQQDAPRVEALDLEPPHVGHWSETSIAVDSFAIQGGKFYRDVYGWSVTGCGWS